MGSRPEAFQVKVRRALVDEPQIFVVFAIRVEEDPVIQVQLGQDILPAPEHDTDSRLVAPACAPHRATISIRLLCCIPARAA